MTPPDEDQTTLAGRLEAAMHAHGGKVKPFIRYLSGQASGRRFESDKRSYHRWVAGGRPKERSRPKLTRWARKLGKPDNYFTSAEVPDKQQALALETRMWATQTRLEELEAQAAKSRADWRQADANLTRLVVELTERVEVLESRGSKARQG